MEMTKAKMAVKVTGTATKELIKKAASLLKNGRDKLDDNLQRWYIRVYTNPDGSKIAFIVANKKVNGELKIIHASVKLVPAVKASYKPAEVLALPQASKPVALLPAPIPQVISLPAPIPKVICLSGPMNISAIELKYIWHTAKKDVAVLKATAVKMAGGTTAFKAVLAEAKEALGGRDFYEVEARGLKTGGTLRFVKA
jgi:hypothetical protein